MNISENRDIGLEHVLAVFARAAEPHPPFPPAELYSEGWMLRLLLDAHCSGRGGLPIKQLAEAGWYSEARLSSPFQPSRRGDPHGEGITHADGVVGDFRFRADTTAGFALAEGARQFVVVEAKMGSKLAAGTTRIRWYDQAVRNVAAMAWTVRSSHLELSSFQSLEFVVVAPEARIAADDSFSRYTDIESVRNKVTRRVGLYGDDDPRRHAELEGFLNWFLHEFLNRLNIHLVSWESTLATLDPDLEAPYASFYDRCIQHNRIGA